MDVTRVVAGSSETTYLIRNNSAGGSVNNIMTTEQIDQTTSGRPLRLWPGIVAAALMVILWTALPRVFPETSGLEMVAMALCGLIILAWWLFFSRAPWIERLGALAVMAAALFVVSFLIHRSVSNGMMGFMLPIYGIPLAALALVLAVSAGRNLSTMARRAAIAVSILIAAGFFTLIRTGGLSGDGRPDLHWRWTPTPEEVLLSQVADQSDPVAPTPEASPTPIADQPADVKATPEPTPEAVKIPDWSGFRGSGRNSIVRGLQIETDWSKSKPVEIWRHPIGPGWSSFAVHGDNIYTQEQRGEDELVTCYSLSTGAPVWIHRDRARFWESNAGAGPRGTPTYSRGRIYSMGATGILNALDARTGKVVWTRNATSDTKSTIPDWGISSSPLIAGDKVIVATAGVLAAYDAATGKLSWTGPAGGYGYSSPQLARIGGVAQVILLNGEGAISLDPADGKLLWKHDWKSDGIVQPAILAGADILIGSGSGMGSIESGIRRIRVAQGDDGWNVQDRWTTKGLKPYFNDFVVHKNNAFGFDGSILACIDLGDGQRKWKGGRYGHGQMVVLSDQDLLLVLSEEGELALVSAAPDKFTELARVPGIEGKTWNHPAIVGDVLLVRNGEQMAAFRLPVK